MVIFLENEKHLEISSAWRSQSGDIEVLTTTANSVYLVEYELEWFAVIEKPYIFPDEPEICRYESYKIKNQLDVYKLNAIL